MVPGSRSAGAVRTPRDHCLATGALPFALRLSAGRPPLDGPATSVPSRRGSVPRVLPTSLASLPPVFGPLVHPCGRVVQPVRMRHLRLGASILIRPRDQVKRFREIHYLYTEKSFRTQLVPISSPSSEQPRPQNRPPSHRARRTMRAQRSRRLAPVRRVPMGVSPPAPAVRRPSSRCEPGSRVRLRSTDR